MPPEPPAGSCQACGAAVEPSARFCGQCGFAQTAAAPARSPASGRWYYNIWFVLFTLFFVLGPLGLPLVWKNPRLSRVVKITLTLVMVVFTWWAVAMGARIFHAAMNELDQIKAVLPY